MFDKKDMDFDEEGVLRETQPNKLTPDMTGMCACVWDEDRDWLLNVCEGHLKYYEHLLEPEILTKDLYKAKCGFDKIWVVASSMGEAVELAEEYFESTGKSEHYAVKRIRLSGKDAVLRGLPSED